MAGAPYYNPVTGVLFSHQGTLAPVGGPRPPTPGGSSSAQRPGVGGGSFNPPGGGSPGVGAGGAGPAVQAGVNTGMAGSFIDRPPLAQNTIDPAMRDDEDIGVVTNVPESELPITASPYKINWDDGERVGSSSVRRGLLMLSDSKRTVDGGSTYAAYYGAGVVHIPPSDYSESTNKAGFLLFSLAASATFGASATNAGWIVRTSPKWNRDRDLDRVSSLLIVVSNPSSGVLRVVATDSGGVNQNAVVARVIRYSTVGYPVSLDGDDDLSSTAISDRVAWDGASTGNLDTSGLTAGTYYVSAWSLSRLGHTQRAIGRVTVA